MTTGLKYSTRVDSRASFLRGDLTNVPRQARNPRIARVMAELSYGQELGEGLRRMVALMEDSGRQRPVVAQDAGGTLVTLYAART